MGNTLRNKVIYFHEKIVFNFRKKIRNYLVANPIFFEMQHFLRLSFDLQNEILFIRIIRIHLIHLEYEIIGRNN